MKMKKIGAGLLCACTMLSCMLPAQATSTIQITSPDASIYVEGIPVIFPSADEKTVNPLISYNGTTYLPLRTAGQWMGKEVGWDASTQTVTLSGSTQKQYVADDDAAYSKYKLFVPPEGDATLNPEISVKLDGKKIDFVNARGETVYPIAFQNATYLPLRNIGELTGLDVTWHGKANERDVNAIFLRTPITEEQKSRMTAYVNTWFPKTKELADKARVITDTAFTQVNAGGSSDMTLTNIEAAQKLLPEMKALAQEIRTTMPAPEGTLLNYYYQQLTDLLDTAITYSDTALEKLNKGEKIIIGTSNPNIDTDQTMAIITSDMYAQYCEWMMRMINQNFERMF